MVPVRLVAALTIASLAAGCGCRSDNEIHPLDPYTELDSDHGKWLSMDVAPDNELAIAFYDVGHDALGFALGDTRDGKLLGWKYEEVDGYADSEGLDSGKRGEFASLKVVPDGTIWVSYYDAGNKNLRAAHRVGRNWTHDLADFGTGPTPDAGKWSSLALDADNRPVIAHYDAGGKKLRVAHYRDGDWSGEEVFAGEDWEGTDDSGLAITRKADAGSFCTLAIHQNTEYIAFYDTAQQTLNLLEGFSGSYAHSVVDDSGNVGQWPSIWTDGDTLAIAYQDADAQDLKLAVRKGGGSFEIQTIDDGDFVGADTALYRRDGHWGVLYFEGRHNNMMRATETDEGWTIETLGGDDRAVGFFNEVAEDKDGTWWAASYDYTNKKIFAQSMP